MTANSGSSSGIARRTSASFRKHVKIITVSTARAVQCRALPLGARKQPVDLGSGPTVRAHDAFWHPSPTQQMLPDQRTSSSRGGRQRGASMSTMRGVGWPGRLMARPSGLVALMAATGMGGFCLFRITTNLSLFTGQNDLGGFHWFTTNLSFLFFSS